jgi:hypothetical protein
LRLLLAIYENKGGAQGGNFDYYKLVKCQFFLNIPEAASVLLSRLVQDEANYLIAY